MLVPLKGLYRRSLKSPWRPPKPAIHGGRPLGINQYERQKYSVSRSDIVAGGRRPSQARRILGMCKDGPSRMLIEEDLNSEGLQLLF